MKRKIALFLSAIMILAVMVIPAHAADTVYNLIDEGSAVWETTEVNGNDITYDFSGGKLVLTSPGAWPHLAGEFETALSFVESDEAVVNVKFTVEDAGGVSSIRLVSGENLIFLHQYAPDAELEEGSGDILAGSYEYSVKLFDLKMDEGIESTRELVLDDGKLVINGIQVWCSGPSNDIKVTIDKLEIVVPGEGSGNEETIANLAAGKSYTKFGYYFNEEKDDYDYPDTDDKELTDGKFAAAPAYGDPAYVGFNFNSTDMKEADTKVSEIVVDLEKKSDLTKYALYTMTGDGGIKAPVSVTVSVSDDKNNWTEVGELAFDKEDKSAESKFVASLEKAASGRYVKFASLHDNAWVFIDEVEVFGKTTSGGNGGTTPPQTSDYALIGFGLVAMISLAGVVVVSRKRV